MLMRTLLDALEALRGPVPLLEGGTACGKRCVYTAVFGRRSASVVGPCHVRHRLTRQHAQLAAQSHLIRAILIIFRIRVGTVRPLLI